MKWLLAIVAIFLVALFVVQEETHLERPTTLVAVGDVMLGRGVATALSHTTIEKAFGDAASALKCADIVFANLESVLTASDKDTGKDIFFKADPARVDALQFLGITHVSVANNHVDDYGLLGWQDSVTALRAAGIEPIGGYRNDGHIVTSRHIAFLAYDDTAIRVDLSKLAADIATATTQADHVVVSFHWGIEYLHEPTLRQVELAHAAIDAGADVVIGSHPHVLQGVETYHGGLILYSLGNFIFDQAGPDQNESVIAAISLAPDVNTVTFTPMRIQNAFPRRATADESTATIARLRAWSATLGTTVDENGRVEWTSGNKGTLLDPKN